MARTERCRHLPKKVRTPYGAVVANKIVDGHAHRQHYDTLIRQKVEKLFGGKAPSWSVFDPKHGTHQKYVPAGYKYPIVDKNSPDGYKWVEAHAFKTFPGSWRRNPERDRWDAIQKKVESEFVRPVASWHPYQGYEAGKKKRTWRQKGNRSLRHATKQKLQDFDPDEDLLPLQDEHYNKRDFW
jgi:hypothetical protein